MGPPPLQTHAGQQSQITEDRLTGSASSPSPPPHTSPPHGGGKRWMYGRASLRTETRRGCPRTDQGVMDLKFTTTDGNSGTARAFQLTIADGRFSTGPSMKFQVQCSVTGQRGHKPRVRKNGQPASCLACQRSYAPPWLAKRQAQAISHHCSSSSRSLRSFGR